MTTNLREKIAGLLYGFAIGDALGLGSELMTRSVVEKKYPDLLTDYSQIVRDAHRSQWKRGEWTTETDTILLLIDSIYERKGIDNIDYATRLQKWFYNHPEDIRSHLRWKLAQPDYSSDPEGVALRIRREMKSDSNPNDGLGRALITGVWNEDVSQNAIGNCKLTHPGSRCEMSAAIIANVANSILWKDEVLPYKTIRESVKKYDPLILKNVELANEGTLSDFDLDNIETYWYVEKALGVSLWALWHCTSPEEALIKIVNEGGDAGTNGAIATGLLGLKYGIGSIDPKYIKGLVNAERIETAVDRLTSVISNRFLSDESLD